MASLGPPVTSSTVYCCRWDFCARTFNTVASLQTHFQQDHIPRERAVYVPAHKRRRREDGAWVLVEESFRLSNEIPLGLNLPRELAGFGGRSGAGAGDVSMMTTMSNLTSAGISDTSLPPLPSFAIPSLPASFSFSQDAMAGSASDNENDNPIETETEPEPEPAAAPSLVDYDAFLRSPSPPTRSQPLPPAFSSQQFQQSTPLSQVPPPSQVALQDLDQDKDKQPLPADTSKNSSASSAAQVTPARGVFVTQAIPPPTPSQGNSSNSTDNDPNASTTSSTPSSAARPAQPLAFGARAAPADSPVRRVSASGVGFTWGLGK
ncbi:uncharacterized protein EHS24_007550 [Apiotrichum porosum]|uniref:C2H2-type domain-containing protein n=1 Tax=Apiotrichum porosum TaxID=105984 RepID=A0A427XUN5_9TREE|nr:uncharacterized protein EHS24_007550 [Apiotrichum porosum]RSH82568.1 hypothetical protein EHS24_007550 [Apiotrichum porosum]